jgi:hypothetical protein
MVLKVRGNTKISTRELEAWLDLEVLEEDAAACAG